VFVTSHIPIGAIDNKQVDFEGGLMSLSASALKVIHRMGYSWKQIAGPDYW
jgi:hypothetical protein